MTYICPALSSSRLIRRVRNTGTDTCFGFGGGGPDFARVLQYLFDDQATFEWPGVPAVSGSTAAAIEWTTRSAKSRFLPRRIIGEDADRVRIEGRIFDLNGAAESPRAGHPATMIWTRRNGFGFRLALFRPGTGG